MICRRCGAEFDPRRYHLADGSAQCPECGAIYKRRTQNSQHAQRDMVLSKPVVYQNRQTGNADRRRRPSFFSKKLWKLPIWAWAVIVVVLLAAIGAGSNTDNNTSIQNTASTNIDASANIAQPIVPVQEKNASGTAPVSIGLSADFGDSKIEAVQATIRTAGSDTYVICEYNWTNNYDYNTMFLAAISENVFQNGIALDSGILLDVDTNTITEVMPGYTITVRTIYRLSDPTAEITFTVGPLLDLLNEYTPLTFTVTPA